MTNQEMKLLLERMKKEEPKLLVLMEKCFDAGVLSGKEQAQRTWVGLTDEEMYGYCPNWLSQEQCKVWIEQIEAKLKAKNSL